MPAISLYKFERSLYEGMPVPLKIAIGWVPFGLLAGKSYREAIKRNAMFEKAGRDEVTAYQEGALHTILDFATDQVPAYRELRSTVGRLRAFEAIKAFPLLDKEALQADFRNYLPRDLSKIRHYECSTGGTSGNQLHFYLDDDAQSIEMAFMHRLWSRLGYAPASRKATFRGVEFRGLQDGEYWQLNPIYNEMQFSPYHMNESTMGAYLEQLVRYKPAFIHGYPSAVSVLANFLLRHGGCAPELNLRGILLGSEALFAGQRETIEQAFKTRAFSWYGHSERLILAGECEKSTAYHQFPDYGFLEIVDDAGNVIGTPGESGELVGTGLSNRSLPLIRYRTGDRARLLEHVCECGRCFDRFDEVEGRWKQEYIIGKNGSPISLAALNMHGPFFDKVIRYQYYQNQPGVMELRVMAAPGFNAADAADLLKAFTRKTGAELRTEIKIVEDIPLTARGKLKRLIQEIPDGES